MFLLLRTVAKLYLPCSQSSRSAGNEDQTGAESLACQSRGASAALSPGLGCSVCSQPSHVSTSPSRTASRDHGPQHATGKGRVQALLSIAGVPDLGSNTLASVCCCLPLGRHNSTAATQERAEREQPYPTSPCSASSVLGKMAINIKNTTNK
ncbi:unnamed protein product [Coccothraustes coccothraustes]